jgi:hypothetical protein
VGGILIPAFHRQTIGRQRHLDHASAVDQRRHRAQLRFDRIGAARERGLVGHIHDPAAAADFACDCVHALVPVEQSELRAAARELPAASRADSARAASDDRYARCIRCGHPASLHRYAGLPSATRNPARLY